MVEVNEPSKLGNGNDHLLYDYISTTSLLSGMIIRT